MLLMSIIDWINHVPDLVKVIVSLATLIGALAVINSKMFKPLIHELRDVVLILRSLGGQPALVSNRTGKEVEPAVPPIHERVAQLEDATLELSKTAKEMKDSNQQVAQALTQLTQIQVSMEAREEAGKKIIEEWTSWRDSHELEAKAREARIHEWEQWRSEQTMLWEYARTQQNTEAIRQIVEAGGTLKDEQE